MTAEDAALARTHLLSQLGSIDLADLAESLAGIGTNLADVEVLQIVDTYVKYAAVQAGMSGERRPIAARLLEQLWMDAPIGVDVAIPKRLEDWEKAYAEKRPDLKDWIAERRSGMEGVLDELPF